MTQTRTTKASKKYAKALFELLKPEQIETTNTALKSAAEIFSAKSEVIAALSDPRYSHADRYTVIERSTF